MKNKTKLLIAFSSAALLSLAACGGQAKNPYASLDNETDADIIQELTVREALEDFSDEDSSTFVPERRATLFRPHSRHRWPHPQNSSPARRPALR